MVPSAANVYAQVVHSPSIRRWNTFEPITLPDGSSVVPPASVVNCPGAAAVHDLQLDQLSLDNFTEITSPTQVFKFVVVISSFLLL